MEVAGWLLVVGGVVEGEVVFSLFVFVVFEVNHLLELFNVVLDVKLDGRRRLRDSVRVNCICCVPMLWMDERLVFVCLCSFCWRLIDFDEAKSGVSMSCHLFYKRCVNVM